MRISSANTGRRFILGTIEGFREQRILGSDHVWPTRRTDRATYIVISVDQTSQQVNKNPDPRVTQTQWQDQGTDDRYITEGGGVQVYLCFWPPQICINALPQVNSKNFNFNKTKGSLAFEHILHICLILLHMHVRKNNLI